MPRHQNNPSGNVPAIPTAFPAVESAHVGRRPPSRQQGRPKLVSLYTTKRTMRYHDKESTSHIVLFAA